jgi:hypothetical protein
MEEAPENGNEPSHSAHAKGMNEIIEIIHSMFTSNNTPSEDNLKMWKTHKGQN